MLRFNSVFSDNMVLQRGTPVRVWGIASPAKKVAVSFAGNTVTTQSNGDGRWEVFLPEMSASPEGRTLSLECDGETVALDNILVGEVWLCAGQSNMQFELERCHGAKSVIASSTNDQIRLLQVCQAASETPSAEIHDSSWQVCSPQSSHGFSAVAYYFGRRLQQRLDVPIGLIHSSWGGTKIESWMSRESLDCIPEISDKLEAYDQLMEASRTERRLGISQDIFQSTNYGEANDWHQAEVSTSDWPIMSLPCQWQQAGHLYSGVFWFRKSVQIPPEWQGKDLEVSLGAIDKSDITYFNGKRIGSLSLRERADSYCINRKYPVPAELVQEGGNCLAVRVESRFFEGGMTGPSVDMHVSCPTAGDGKQIAISGEWAYQVELNSGHSHPGSPTELFNAMISPFVPFAIRGAIWYQGESNTDRPAEYRTLLEGMISDWRQRWGLGDFPFLIVLLVSARNEEYFNADSNWAVVRAGQQQAAESLPNVGIASAMDFPDDDVHSRMKEPVGNRLAAQALTIVDGSNEVSRGPLPDSCVREGSKVRVVFNTNGAPLTTSDGKGPIGFVVCGTDGEFHPATGHIDGDSVTIESPNVASPCEVRYAWANSPIFNLYNAAGYPAEPFGITVG